jgi:hypothetical protein
MGRGSWISLAFALVVAAAGCSDPVVYLGVRPDPTSMPATWQEHWFEHDQLLSLAANDDVTALYYDKDVDRAQAGAIFPYLSLLVHHSIDAYGPLGPGRVFFIVHKDRYLGCHAADFTERSHDFRNVIDCGITAYDDPTVFQAFLPHLAALLVESVVDGHHGTPVDAIWRQGKWAEFYRYDLYLALGRKDLADQWQARWTAADFTDPFPMPGVHWFRDWSFPLWRDFGGAAVMKNFFALLARDFPSEQGEYTRDMTMGEFVHFMSGAAGTDLKERATFAFGWTVDWEAQLQAARAAFPGITY